MRLYPILTCAHLEAGSKTATNVGVPKWAVENVLMSVMNETSDSQFLCQTQSLQSVWGAAFMRHRLRDFTYLSDDHSVPESRLGGRLKVRGQRCLICCTVERETWTLMDLQMLTECVLSSTFVLGEGSDNLTVVYPELLSDRDDRLLWMSLPQDGFIQSPLCRESARHWSELTCTSY